MFVPSVPHREERFLFTTVCTAGGWGTDLERLRGPWTVRTAGASCPWLPLPSYLNWAYYIAPFKAKSRKPRPFDQTSVELLVSYVTGERMQGTANT